MDPARLQASWQRVTQRGDAVPAFFYAALFTTYPQLRAMFPVSMAGQRDRLVSALGRVVSNVHAIDTAVPFVQQLGRDHRKFEVRPEHFPAVGEALLATLAYFLGDDWTDDLADDWTTAYQLVAGVMVEAADQSAQTTPAWWTAEVVGHERRGLDVAVLTVAPNPPYPYVAGQSISVHSHLRPRVWRHLSPANSPRQDGLIELHVRAVPGGQLSTALVTGAQRGDILRLGAAIGNRLTLDPSSDRDLLMIAGGTGLAPLKALVEQLATEGRSRQVTLVFGARTAPDLYDLPALEALARDLRWLTVRPALSHDQYSGYEQGTAIDVALRHGRWADRDVYVCGNVEMVADTVERLQKAGLPYERIHHEDFTADPYRPAGIQAPADPRSAW